MLHTCIHAFYLMNELLLLGFGSHTSPVVVQEFELEEDAQRLADFTCEYSGLCTTWIAQRFGVCDICNVHMSTFATGIQRQLTHAEDGFGKSTACLTLHV